MIRALMLGHADGVSASAGSSRADRPTKSGMAPRRRAAPSTMRVREIEGMTTSLRETAAQAGRDCGLDRGTRLRRQRDGRVDRAGAANTASLAASIAQNAASIEETVASIRVRISH